MSTAPFPSSLRVTFDSNVWQMAVMPSLAGKTGLFADFVVINDALQTKGLSLKPLEPWRQYGTSGERRTSPQSSPR
jgi:hypothetical protein